MRDEAVQAMRARLVAAAIDQLADEGMRGVTHRRVEQRAQVGQGLVKYHFGSLDGLIAAVVSSMAEIELDSVMRVAPEHQAVALASLPCADPRAAARLVLALVNGLLLHQLAAHEVEVDALAPAYLIATGAAAMTFPLKPCSEV